MPNYAVNYFYFSNQLEDLSYIPKIYRCYCKRCLILTYCNIDVSLAKSKLGL